MIYPVVEFLRHPSKAFANDAQPKMDAVWDRGVCTSALSGSGHWQRAILPLFCDAACWSKKIIHQTEPDFGAVYWLYSSPEWTGQFSTGTAVVPKTNHAHPTNSIWSRWSAEMQTATYGLTHSFIAIWSTQQSSIPKRWAVRWGMKATVGGTINQIGETPEGRPVTRN